MENSENNVMTLDEIKVAFDEASVDITKLYVNDISSKLKLANKIAWIEDEKIKYIPSNLEGKKWDEYYKVYEDFKKSLPFEKASYEKYLAIGKNANWLKEIGKDKLPNDYNSLAYFQVRRL